MRKEAIIAEVAARKALHAQAAAEAAFKAKQDAASKQKRRSAVEKLAAANRTAHSKDYDEFAASLEAMTTEHLRMWCREVQCVPGGGRNALLKRLKAFQWEQGRADRLQQESVFEEIYKAIEEDRETAF